MKLWLDCEGLGVEGESKNEFFWWFGLKTSEKSVISLGPNFYHHKRMNGHASETDKQSFGPRRHRAM